MGGVLARKTPFVNGDKTFFLQDLCGFRHLCPVKEEHGESRAVYFSQQPHLFQSRRQLLPLLLGFPRQPRRRRRGNRTRLRFIIVKRTLARVAFKHFQGGRFRFPASDCHGFTSHFLECGKSGNFAAAGRKLPAPVPGQELGGFTSPSPVRRLPRRQSAGSITASILYRVERSFRINHRLITSIPSSILRCCLPVMTWFA